MNDSVPNPRRLAVALLLVPANQAMACVPWTDGAICARSPAQTIPTPTPSSAPEPPPSPEPTHPPSPEPTRPTQTAEPTQAQTATPTPSCALPTWTPLPPAPTPARPAAAPPGLTWLWLAAGLLLVAAGIGILALRGRSR